MGGFGLVCGISLTVVILIIMLNGDFMADLFFSRGQMSSRPHI